MPRLYFQKSEFFNGFLHLLDHIVISFLLTIPKDVTSFNDYLDQLFCTKLRVDLQFRGNILYATSLLSEFFNGFLQLLDHILILFLLTIPKDVRANCFRAFLLCLHIFHVMHEFALRNIMKNDRADGHCYSFAWI